MKTPEGGRLGERFIPLERVGVYIPGGEAPLVSTALMTVTLANIAGVPEIVACTPCDEEGKINPYILYALKLAGATEVYRVGGIQAIGAMAYGTKTIRKVLKIVGPGGPYVTAAKKLVYGDVDLDLVAGPSEIAVVVDRNANPAYAAADLLSQAEHGTGYEKALLISTSMAIAKRVREELIAQAAKLSRRRAIEGVLKKGTMLVVVSKPSEAVSLVNDFAPEHVELLVDNPTQYLRGITNAGAAFLGPWTPESVGDFVAGPSHVLPTGGTAKMFSGLTVEAFRKKMSVIQFSKKDLKKAVPTISAFGRVEDLDGHARSAEIRFEE